MRKAHEEARAQRALLFHFAAARLDLAVGRVEARLAHHVRQHRALPPGHRRRGLAFEHPEERLARPQAGFVHVHMRVRLVARDDVGVRDDGRVQVGVHVQGHGDRRFRRDPAHAGEQLALPVVEAFGDHRAVQVEEDRVGLPAGRLADPAGHVFERRVLHGTAWPGAARHRQRDVRARLFGKLDERADRRTRAPQRLDRSLAFEGHRRADREALYRRGHRREGVGLVFYLRDDDIHCIGPLHPSLYLSSCLLYLPSSRGVHSISPWPKRRT